MDINSKAYEDFLNMEQNAAPFIPGFKLKDGINVWSHLRICYFGDFYLGCESYLKNNLGFHPGIECPAFDLPPSFYKQLTTLTQPDVLIFSDLACHVEDIDGKKYDPYLDPLISEISRQGMRPLKLSLYLGGELPETFVPTIILPIVTIKNHVIYYTSLPDIPGYEAYFHMCVKQNVFPIHRVSVLQSHARVNAYAELFTKILDMIKPRIVILQEYYNYRAMGMAQACYQLKIPCVEYQHGVQDWPHLPYNFQWMPERGYEVVPEWFFMWGECAADDMRERCKNQHFHKVAVTGKPNYCAWRHGELQDDPDVLAHFLRKIEGKIPICVALPLWVDDKKFDAFRRMLAQAPLNWIWLFRKHPLYPSSESQFVSEYSYKIESDFCSKLNLHTVLKYSVHLFTGMSSCTLEAIALHNMEVTCIHEDSQLYFKKEMISGEVRYAELTDDMLKSVSIGIKHYPCQNKNAYITQDISLFGKTLRNILTY